MADKVLTALKVGPATTEMREFDRASTTLFTAEVAPLMASYLIRLGAGLASLGLESLTTTHRGASRPIPSSAPHPRWKRNRFAKLAFRYLRASKRIRVWKVSLAAFRCLFGTDSKALSSGSSSRYF